MACCGCLMVALQWIFMEEMHFSGWPLIPVIPLWCGFSAVSLFIFWVGPACGGLAAADSWISCSEKQQQQQQQPPPPSIHPSSGWVLSFVGLCCHPGAATHIEKTNWAGLGSDFTPSRVPRALTFQSDFVYFSRLELFVHVCKEFCFIAPLQPPPYS